MQQHELDRSGTSYEDQPHQRDPRSFITQAQDPAHAYLPVSQYNAQLLQDPERKPTLQLIPTIQESPQFSPQQQPPISNHLPPSSIVEAEGSVRTYGGVFLLEDWKKGEGT